jgi:hypothetical protein
MIHQRPKVGDLFAIPIDVGLWGIGQVVESFMNSYYLAIYEGVETDIDDGVDLEAAIRRPLVFLALALDAKIYVGDWPIVGHTAVPKGIPFPAFKVSMGAPENVQVIDYLDRRRRKATPAESALLPDMSFVAPVRIEKALKAKYGLLPWNAAYAALEPSPATTTGRMFPSE